MVEVPRATIVIQVRRTPISDLTISLFGYLIVVRD